MSIDAEELVDKVVGPEYNSPNRLKVRPRYTNIIYVRKSRYTKEGHTRTKRHELSLVDLTYLPAKLF